MPNLILNRSQLSGNWLTLTVYQRRHLETKKSDQNQTMDYKNILETKHKYLKLSTQKYLYVLTIVCSGKDKTEKTKPPPLPPKNIFNVYSQRYGWINYGILKILFIFWKQRVRPISIDPEKHPWYIREEKQASE